MVAIAFSPSRSYLYIYILCYHQDKCKGKVMQTSWLIQAKKEDALSGKITVDKSFSFHCFYLSIGVADGGWPRMVASSLLVYIYFLAKVTKQCTLLLFFTVFPRKKKWKKLYNIRSPPPFLCCFHFWSTRSRREKKKWNGNMFFWASQIVRFLTSFFQILLLPPF